MLGSPQKYNLHAMGTLEIVEGEEGTEEIFETIVTENFPKLM